MAGSRMPAVWRRLAVIFAAARPDPTAQEVVFGAVPETDDLLQRVYVAYSGDPSDPTMASFARGWRGLGARERDEMFEVPCGIVCRWGDDPNTADLDADGIPDVVDQLLDQTFVLFDAMDAAICADPGLGLSGVSQALISSGSVVPDPGVLTVRLPFLVTYSTQLTI